MRSPRTRSGSAEAATRAPRSSALRSRATFPVIEVRAPHAERAAGDAVLELDPRDHPRQRRVPPDRRDLLRRLREPEVPAAELLEAVGPVEDRGVLAPLATLTALAHRDVVPEALVQELHLPVQRFLNAEDVEIERFDGLEDVPAPLHPLVPRVALARSRVADVEGRHAQRGVGVELSGRLFRRRPGLSLERSGGLLPRHVTVAIRAGERETPEENDGRGGRGAVKTRTGSHDLRGNVERERGAAFCQRPARAVRISSRSPLAMAARQSRCAARHVPPGESCASHAFLTSSARDSPAERTRRASSARSSIASRAAAVSARAAPDR